MKTELHHWWPTSLSRYWGDHEEKVTWISPDKSEKRLAAKSLGAITNGHAVRLGELWSASFEKNFQSADENFSSVVETLFNLDSDFTRTVKPIRDSLLPVKLDTRTHNQLREGVASIVVRSPRNRERIISYATSFRGEIECSIERANLEALNVNRQFAGATRALQGGKFIIIYSTDNEFIFGDGFYNNLDGGIGNQSNVKAAVPLTPNMLVLYGRPLRCSKHPEVFTVRATDDEVEKFNDLVQVYAKQYVFYRSKKPTVNPSFEANAHLTIKYNSIPWIDEIIKNAASH